MDIPQINFVAILIATISSFFLGGLWYSKLLFGKAWMQEAGISEEKIQKGNMLKTFSFAILATLIITFNLAMFLGPDSTFVTGVLYGFLAGFGWIAMAFAINDVFEQRSFKLFAINAGYHTLSLSMIGGIIGAWH